ncbi:MAG: hypothetical protein ACRC1Z_24820 [Waterburya sp.]
MTPEIKTLIIQVYNCHNPFPKTAMTKRIGVVLATLFLFLTPEYLRHQFKFIDWFNQLPLSISAIVLIINIRTLREIFEMLTNEESLLTSLKDNWKSIDEELVYLEKVDTQSLNIECQTLKLTIQNIQEQKQFAYRSIYILLAVSIVFSASNFKNWLLATLTINNYYLWANIIYLIVAVTIILTTIRYSIVIYRHDFKHKVYSQVLNTVNMVIALR